MTRPRRNHTAAVKAKAAIAALKGDETLAALAEKFDVHRTRSFGWLCSLGIVYLFVGFVDRHENRITLESHCRSISGFAHWLRIAA